LNAEDVTRQAPLPTLREFTAIARKHRLSLPTHVPMPWVGATSRVFPVGDHVVKVPFDDPAAIRAVMTDAVVEPIVHGHGVATRELFALDDSCETLAVPFSIFRRIQPAVSLADYSGPSQRVTRAWEEVGRHLAIVHRITSNDAVPTPLRTFQQSAQVDPRPWVAELTAAGVLCDADAWWLRNLLEDLVPLVRTHEPKTLCHGDVNAANVLVHPDSGRFLALIDWAGAGWLDPVWDFASVSLNLVPSLLTGHRSIAPLPDDHSAEARICWVQTQTRLLSARSATPSSDVKHHLARDMEQIRQFAVAAGLSTAS
jgi:hypothetical protein